MRKAIYAMLMIGALGMTACQTKVIEKDGAGQVMAVNTESSVHTEAPEKTEEAKATEKPVATVEPKETEKPVAIVQPKETKEPAATVQPKKTEEPAATVQPKKTQKPANVGETYYGTWKITDYKSLRITAIGGEEIDELMGTTVSYSKEKFENMNGMIKNPNYQESVETKKEFEEDTKSAVTFKDLGVKSNSMKCIDIPNVDTIGGYFCVINNEKIAIYYQGVYFIATRI